LNKLQLHGFNNLTKSLSFNIYDICYAPAEQQQAYIEYIDEAYNADKLTQILKDVAEIIGAQVLNIARQDYEPQGASVTMLISEGEAPPPPSMNSQSPGPCLKRCWRIWIKAILLCILILKAIPITASAPFAPILTFPPAAGFRR